MTYADRRAAEWAVVCTEGRTQPASWSAFYRRMRGIGKGAWREVQYQSRELYQDTRGLLKDTKRGVKDVLGLRKHKDQDYYQAKADKAYWKAQEARVHSDPHHVEAGSHQL